MPFDLRIFFFAWLLFGYYSFGSASVSFLEMIYINYIENGAEYTEWINLPMPIIFPFSDGTLISSPLPFHHFANSPFQFLNIIHDSTPLNHIFECNWWIHNLHYAEKWKLSHHSIVIFSPRGFFLDFLPPPLLNHLDDVDHCNGHNSSRQW